MAADVWTNRSADGGSRAVARDTPTAYTATITMTAAVCRRTVETSNTIIANTATCSTAPTAAGDRSGGHQFGGGEERWQRCQDAGELGDGDGDARGPPAEPSGDHERDRDDRDRSSHDEDHNGQHSNLAGVHLWSDLEGGNEREQRNHPGQHQPDPTDDHRPYPQSRASTIASARLATPSLRKIAEM